GDTPTGPPQPAVASVSVNAATNSLVVGETIQLTAGVKDQAGAALTGRTVTWASSSSAVATVSASGLVAAVSSGSATITAASEGKSGAMTVTVASPASRDFAID